MIAILDANVLYKAPLRDYLLCLAELGVYDPGWTNAIQDEWARNLLKVRPDLIRASIESVHRAMDDSFIDSKVTEYESIIDDLVLPDPDDRHVLAAAIKRNARIIVTVNLKDFPPKALAHYNVRAEHPDQFTLACIERERLKAIQALKNQQAKLKNPPMTLDKVLESLDRCGLIKSVAALRKLIGKI